MPHSKYGRVGWFLGGMGCKGITQAVQIREFWKAGIMPDVTLSESIGTCNRLDPEHAVDLYEVNFYSPWEIFDLNHKLKEIAEHILGNLPRSPHSPFHRHNSRTELIQDFKEQPRRLAHVFGFIIRAARFLLWAAIKRDEFFPSNQQHSSRDFVSALQFVVSEANRRNFSLPESFLTVDPLISQLKKLVNTENIIKSPTTWQILTLSGAEEHIFEVGAPSPPEVIAKIKARKRPIEVRAVSSVNELFDACQAAISLTPIIEPFPIGEYLYWDAGEENPFPVEYLMDTGCDTIFAFVRDYWEKPHRPKRNEKINFIEWLMRNSDISARANFFQLYERAMARAEREGKKIYIIKHQPLHPDLDLLSISPEGIRHAKKVESEYWRGFINKKLGVDY